jgi:hypothetical protein
VLHRTVAAIASAFITSVVATVASTTRAATSVVATVASTTSPATDVSLCTCNRAINGRAITPTASTAGAATALSLYAFDPNGRTIHTSSAAAATKPTASANNAHAFASAGAATASI